MLVVLTVDGRVRDIELREVTNDLSTCRRGERRDPVTTELDCLQKPATGSLNRERRVGPRFCADGPWKENRRLKSCR